jgi:hypothetical protein
MIFAVSGFVPYSGVSTDVRESIRGLNLAAVKHTTVQLTT